MPQLTGTQPVRKGPVAIRFCRVRIHAHRYEWSGRHEWRLGHCRKVYRVRIHAHLVQCVSQRKGHDFFSTFDILSSQPITKADSTKVRWMITYHINFSLATLRASIKYAAGESMRSPQSKLPLCFQRAGIHLAEPAQLLAFIDIQLGDKVLIAGQHHHDQQATNQRHVHQRQQQQNQIVFAMLRMLGSR